MKSRGGGASRTPSVTSVTAWFGGASAGFVTASGCAVTPGPDAGSLPSVKTSTTPDASHALRNTSSNGEYQDRQGLPRGVVGGTVARPFAWLLVNGVAFGRLIAVRGRKHLNIGTNPHTP